MIKSSITYISETEFLPAFYAAFQATMTESNTKGGFRGAGLVPLNLENVILKLDVKLRIPNTVREVKSQSEYLERRIRGHKSSSQESIIEALKSLVKAVTRIYHEVTLLSTENRELRQANKALCRRRRAKRTRL
jgi:hypothetical protein